MPALFQLVACLFFLVVPMCLIGQADSLPEASLEEVILTGQRPWKWQPLSSGTDSMQLLETFQPGVRNAFLREPGVFAYNGENFAQDVRISIRGFGSRSAFGIRGIRVWMDGIPLTSPDGTSQLDELSLWDVGTISWLRSGLAARYGNAAGGGMMLSSPVQFKGLQLRTAVSPSGAWNGGLRMGYGRQNTSHLTSFNHQYFQGQRDFAASRNFTVYHKTSTWLTKNWKLMLVGGAYHSPLGQDPGALNASEFDADRFQANTRNIQYLAGEAVSGGHVGMQSRIETPNGLVWVSSPYYRKRIFEARLPFTGGGWINLHRNLAGWHNTLEYSLLPSWKIATGTSLEWQQDSRRLAQNNNGSKGTASADQNEGVQNAGFWLQQEVSYRRIRMQQTTRFDVTQFYLDDLFLSDGDQSGESRFQNLNAALSAQSLLFLNLLLHAGISTGFETPTLNELTNNPLGTPGLNESLQAETSWQAEFGFRSDKSRAWNWSATGFNIELKDAILGYELPQTPGRTYFRNAPRARRTGLEMAASWAAKGWGSIEVQYTASRFQYRDFPSGTANFQGNIQPLIPMQRLGLRLQSSLGKYLDASVQCAWQSSMFADDGNLVRIPGFVECNAHVSTTNTFHRYIQLGLTASNVFGTMTYSNIRANAAGMRYYEAATPNLISLFASWTMAKRG